MSHNVARLVLYEPVFGLEADEPMLQRLDRLVDAGAGGEAVSAYMRAVGLTVEEAAELRSSPTWAERVDAAHTLSREDQASSAYSPSPRRPLPGACLSHALGTVRA